jgi:hypothetical protein
VSPATTAAVVTGRPSSRSRKSPAIELL